MNKDEALEIALEALELHGKQYPHMVKGYCLDAITAIKKALETKDEPVGWIDSKGNMICVKTDESCRPLYTTPQRKPLTDEQIWDAYIAYVNAPVDIDCHVSDLHKFARAIEAAHGIKELA